MSSWKIESLLRESREAESRAKDYELRTRRARREAVHARMAAWRLTVQARDRDAKHARLHRKESKRLRQRAYKIQMRPEE